MTARDVQATISESPWTVLVLSSDGQIVEAVPFSGAGTPDALLEFARKQARGRKFRLVQQADLSEAQLRAMVCEVLKPVGQSETSDKVAERLEEFQPSLHPFAAVRVIAETLGKWFSR